MVFRWLTNRERKKQENIVAEEAVRTKKRQEQEEREELLRKHIKTINDKMNQAFCDSANITMGSVYDGKLTYTQEFFDKQFYPIENNYDLGYFLYLPTFKSVNDILIFLLKLRGLKLLTQPFGITRVTRVDFPDADDQVVRILELERGDDPALMKVVIAETGETICYIQVYGETYKYSGYDKHKPAEERIDKVIELYYTILAAFKED